MKVTKGYLKKLIREELGRFDEAEVPSELVKSWASQIEKFIRDQVSPGGVPMETHPELPAVITALEQVRTTLRDSTSTRDMREGFFGGGDPLALLKKALPLVQDVSKEAADYVVAAIEELEYPPGSLEEALPSPRDYGDFPEKVLDYLQGSGPNTTINGAMLAYAFGGSQQKHTRMLQAMVDSGQLVYNKGEYGLP